MISLSNLLKQYYVVNLQNEKRVINSDERYCMDNNMQAPEQDFASVNQEVVPGSEEILDGFLAGLDAESVSVEPQVNVDEILEEARMEADAIIAQAKAEALKITSDAEREANLVFEQQKAAGYNTGVANLQAEMERQRAELQMEYEEKENALQSDYMTRLDTMETDIVDALITVFNKVFAIQFDDKREILLHLIKTTLLNVDAGKDLRIRVAGENHQFVESRIGDIKEKIGNDVNIEIVNDMTLQAGDCLIETAYGVFNCGIDMELTSLLKDIKSLCK